MDRRKKNRLDGYDYSQPGAYFITVCVKDHKCLLGAVVGADDHIGPTVKLTQTGKVVEEFTRSIPGVGHYVVMPNHVHMILHISAKSPMEGPMCLNRPLRKGAFWAEVVIGPHGGCAIRADVVIGPYTGCAIWADVVIGPYGRVHFGPKWSSAPTK